MSSAPVPPHPPSLAYDVLNSPTMPSDEAAKTLCVIHGLLGVGRNLHTLTRTLLKEAEAPGAAWKALLLDLRNHGRSSRVPLPPPHDLSAAAADVVAVLRSLGAGAGSAEAQIPTAATAPHAIIGHSLGGKVALELLAQLARHAEEGGAASVVRIPRHVWVLDSWPGLVNRGHGASQDILKVVETLRSIPQPLRSREQLYELLSARGMSLAMQHWLGSSLGQDGPGAFRFLFNLDGAEDLFMSYCDSGTSGDEGSLG
ncbi:hypothetical protein H632_c1958p1 [Helicosporidium sp. ATCC 50920]|nr:hypothetical protein H632_c1958p1 [Helicosporidium sp. ATCC 50920]|eukprot:KDD73657.1 hypothetical protein H632_c1958p1 [Helicosporidium sp. ATCC 50920]